MKLGSRLADRYLVEASATFSVPGADVWLARNERLDRAVVVLVASDADGQAIEDAAQRARIVRHPSLARIVEVGVVEADASASPVQSFIVVERPQGLLVADLVARRIVPPDVARSIVGEAAKAASVAAKHGLHHGALSGEWLTVTARGGVVLGGAGVVDSLAVARVHGRPVSERQDARALAGLFAQAVTGLRPRAVTPDSLPTDLTPTERALIASVARGGGPNTLADVIEALSPWDGTLLRGLSRREVSFVAQPDARRPRSAVVAPPVGGSEVAAPTPSVESTVATSSSVLVRPDLGEEALDEDEWSLDQLEILEDAGPTPSVFEAVVGFLHRRFPRAKPVTRLLERIHARASSGPRLHAQRWFLAIGLIAVLVGLLLSVKGVRSPGPDEPAPSPHQYPDFTFSPEVTPSPGT